MMLSELALALMSRSDVDPVQGFTWAWHIQHDYPAELREAAEAWAQNRPVGNPQVDDMTLEGIMRSTGTSVPQALEVLYVFTCDVSGGQEIIEFCARRD